MTSDDVTDGCAPPRSWRSPVRNLRDVLPLEEDREAGVGIQHHAVKTYVWLRFAARGVLSLSCNLSRLTSRVLLLFRDPVASYRS